MADEGNQQQQQGEGQEAAADDRQQGEGQQQQQAAADDAGNVTDSHGQPGINKERHDKEVAGLKAQIEALEAEAADAAEQKAKRGEFEQKVADLEAKLADTQVTHSLEMAGCKNVKAAKALLEDYDGDISKLKAECPYLFGAEKQTGSTGFQSHGAPSTSEERRKKAREAAAGNLTIKR